MRLTEQNLYRGSIICNIFFHIYSRVQVPGLPWQAGLALFAAGCTYGVLGVFAVPCSIAVLRETRLHAFVREQFGFLDVLLLRGAAFALAGTSLYAVSWSCFALAKDDSWARIVMEVLLL